jgi:DNA-binding NarL/FixJ family response regulator
MSFRITQREKTLLTMLCVGLTIPAMAEDLGVSASCVRCSFDRLRIKFRVKSRVELAVYAVRNGIV